MDAITIDPPLLNSSNPWATSYEDLHELYANPFTGAISTRTSTLLGFPEDQAVHRYAFFESHNSNPSASLGDSSINTLGYSPHRLEVYLEWIAQLVAAFHPSNAPSQETKPTSSRRKPIIISVTGSATEVAECYRLVCSKATELEHPLLMEINLSCPNIPGAPPPAYSPVALTEYLEVVQKSKTSMKQENKKNVPIGIKTPPYTHADQFSALIEALVSTTTRSPPDSDSSVCPVEFITATNTLGSCLVLTDHHKNPVGPAVSGYTAHRDALSTGGVGGAALHPLALGNVATLRHLLNAQQDSPSVAAIRIIGVGGVASRAGYERMRSVGAWAVGVGTALGIHGVDIFAAILTNAHSSKSS